MKSTEFIKISMTIYLLLSSFNFYGQNTPPITLNVEAAGNLSKLLGDKSKEIQELTLTGEINASDIHVIRNMGNLITLNLRDVNIRKGGKFSYSWQGGTPDTGYKTYTQERETKDNEIPIEMLYRAKCKNLKTLILPKSVTKIGFIAFQNYEGALSNLESIELGENIIEIGSGAFAHLNMLKSIILPNGLTDIYRGTFVGCTALSSIHIPNSVKTIDGFSSSYVSAGAFERCKNLISITIPKGVTEIRGYAFKECTGLKSIEVSSENENYQSIDGVLFTKDKRTLVAYPNAKEIFYTIPNETTVIGEYAFYKCINLKDLYVNISTPPTTNKDSFYGINTTCSLYVPKNTYATYWVAEGWRDFKNIYEKDFPTSNETITISPIEIYSTDNFVMIKSEKNISVYIYSIAGQLIKQLKMQGEQQINLPVGAYIVNAENYTQKVLIK